MANRPTIKYKPLSIRNRVAPTKRRESWRLPYIMCKVTGMLPDGVRITCYSRERADAVAELEGLGGVLDK